MGNMTVNSNYRHRTYCYQGDQVAISTRYLRVTAVAATPMTESIFISTLDGVLQALYLPLLTNSALYVGSNIQSLLGGPPFEQPWGTNANQANGTAGGNPLPAQVCGLYGTTSEFTGPGYRGRSYVPFPDDSAVAVGPPPVPKGSYLTLLAALANQVTGTVTLTAGGGSVTFQWTIANFLAGGALFSYVPLTGFVVRPRWATQKRRGDYGRTNPMPVP